METLDNPVLKVETADEVLADLEKYDAESVPETTGRTPNKTARPSRPSEHPAEAKAPVEQKEPEPKPDEKPETSVEKTAEVEGERARDEHGRFIKKDEVSVAEDASGDKAAESTIKDTSESRPDTAYEKAKKDAERKDRSWKALEEEKARERAAIAAEKASIAREREQLQAQMQQRQQQNGERPRDEFGNIIYSSHEYAAEAKRLRQLALKGEVGPNGEDYADLSEKAENASQVMAQREAVAYQKQYKEAQDRIALQVFNSEPELANPESPLAKEMPNVFAFDNELAQKYGSQPTLTTSLYGFAASVEVAKLRVKAFSADEWKAKYEAAQAEVDRLNKLTSVSSSSPTQHRSPKTFDQMTTAEQEAAMDAAYRNETGRQLVAR